MRCDGVIDGLSTTLLIYCWVYVVVRGLARGSGLFGAVEGRSGVLDGSCAVVFWPSVEYFCSTWTPCREMVVCMFVMA
jgi:hypothetical protein